MPGKVQVGRQEPYLFCSDTGRPLVVDLYSETKRLLILHPEVQHTLTGGITRLQLRVDLPHVWILPEKLQAFLQSIQVERLSVPAPEAANDVAVAKPFVAVQLGPG